MHGHITTEMNWSWFIREESVSVKVLSQSIVGFSDDDVTSSNVASVGLRCIKIGK